MDNNIYDLTDIFTKDRILTSLKHAQDANALLRFDVHVNKSGSNIDEDIELLWEVVEGDYLANKDNTLGYQIDYITAIFRCDVVKTKTADFSEQAVLIGLSSVKVETDMQSIEGDLYLPNVLSLSVDDFRQTLERLEKKQNAQGWVQPALCFN